MTPPPAAPAPPVRLPVHRDDGRLVVRIYQVVDLATAPAVQDALLGLVRTCADPCLVLDLRCHLLTSTGVDVLDRTRTAAAERGLGFRLVTRHRLARDVLRAAAPVRLLAADESFARELAQGEAATGPLEELHRTLRPRPEIDMARGMLMALASCSAEEAWLLLALISRNAHTPLPDVAHHLVRSASGPPLPAPIHEALTRHTALRGRPGTRP
ncbi:ANTAR domain-containing protein [Streptomyces sp. NPDC004111]|uniref:ANTAR domain-containing protein n=1 Tax=Streptomyces sp. NPDC004111 TaxID=3364690 RepID=UPI0036BE98A7